MPSISAPVISYDLQYDLSLGSLSNTNYTQSLVTETHFTLLLSTHSYIWKKYGSHPPVRGEALWGEKIEISDIHWVPWQGGEEKLALIMGILRLGVFCPVTASHQEAKRQSQVLT